ncbi:hypothetical protein [Actinocorallia longicatena]
MIATLLVAPGGDWREPDTGVPGELTEITSPGYGTAYALGTSAAKPLLLTWAGHQWKRAAPPLPENALLTGVSAAAPDDADVTGFSGQTPLALHWDGASWTPRPFAEPLPGFPRAIDAGWIVGSTSGFAGTQAAAWRRTGGTWTPVTVPGGPGSGLVAIDGGNAVGTRLDHALIVRWDGTRWIEETPDLGPDAELTDVAGDYAVGTRRKAPLVLHRENGTWKPVTAPKTLSAGLTSVAPDGSGGIWAAGRAGFHHYDGTAWTLSPERGTVRALALTRGTSFLWAAGGKDGRAVTWTTAPRPR